MGTPQNTINILIERADQSLQAAQMLYQADMHLEANSRAYYSMFYAAKACLTSINVRAKSHSATGHLLSQHFVKTGKLERQYTQMLTQAMQIREDSDYNVMVTPAKEITAGLIRDAEMFVERMKQLLK